jgi:hypothetical protein
MEVRGKPYVPAAIPPVAIESEVRWPQDRYGWQTADCLCIV